MLDTRRCFLKSLAGISSSFLLFQSSPPIPAPRRRTPVDPPTPAEKQDTDTPKDNSRNALHPAQVFSVAVFKQTQEIEKLAKQLKNYARA
jgi:hypothetical protein